MLWSCDIYQDLLWAKMYINTFHVFITSREQAGRHIHIYTTRIYVYVTVASAMFGFVVDDITRTRYLRKPSASASPIRRTDPRAPDVARVTFVLDDTSTKPQGDANTQTRSPLRSSRRSSRCKLRTSEKSRPRPRPPGQGQG